jgi:asparagine synthase (glutamine-hydrolysing)
VIGAAMLPMYYVSQLAARHVKVCLGGQAADELFGGYARYALARPVSVLWSWGRARARALLTRAGRGPHAGAGGDAPGVAQVGGNLNKQLVEPATLLRLARRVPDAFDWRARYFNNFAKVSERTWRGLFADPAFVSRADCYETYRDTLARSAATDPADLVMHWDMQTYLTGLFHQDDRMSMANSLESRVPLADTRLVRFAFGAGVGLKFRDGASKWILRQAVADAIPREVLTRRKVGFDTPAERWMRTTQRGFVRDLLLSTRARARGFVDPGAVARVLDRPAQAYWFDVVWKLVCIEAWATVFLDGALPAGVTHDPLAAGRERASGLPSE